MGWQACCSPCCGCATSLHTCILKHECTLPRIVAPSVSASHAARSCPTALQADTQTCVSGTAQYKQDNERYKRESEQYKQDAQHYKDQADRLKKGLAAGIIITFAGAVVLTACVMLLWQRRR